MVAIHSALNQAIVMYGLLLSPRYKELREVDAFWAAAHPSMSKDERKEACLVVVEQFEASLIDLMTATAQFGRVDIVIDDDVGIGENKHNTPALVSRQHVHTHANTYTHIFLLYTSRFVFK